ARHDLRQRGLAESRGAYEQHVVERLAALARRLDEHGEILARLRLADELRQHLRTQRGVAGVLVAPFGRDDARRRVHFLLPRQYLFGNSLPILATFGSLPLLGTMTLALAS